VTAEKRGRFLDLMDASHHFDVTDLSRGLEDATASPATSEWPMAHAGRVVVMLRVALVARGQR